MPSALRTICFSTRKCPFTSARFASSSTLEYGADAPAPSSRGLRSQVEQDAKGHSSVHHGPHEGDLPVPPQGHSHVPDAVLYEGMRKRLQPFNIECQNEQFHSCHLFLSVPCGSLSASLHFLESEVLMIPL